MPYIPPDVVAQARKMDLLTYLRNYEPDELVPFSRDTYCTRTHDSLKISNGKWFWFSRGIGGASALDYLIKVQGIPFTRAVEQRREAPVCKPARDRHGFYRRGQRQRQTILLQYSGPRRECHAPPL